MLWLAARFVRYDYRGVHPSRSNGVAAVPITMLINLKGGVAKTTSAIAIAECLATKGHKTLLIDADHQSMSSELLLGEERLIGREEEKDPKGLEGKKLTLHDLLAEMLEPDFDAERFPKYVAPKGSNINNGLPNLSVLPCSYRIDNFYTNMFKARKRFDDPEQYQVALKKERGKFRRWLNTQFDYVIVDCPPSLAFHVRFLLGLADNYIVPCIPDRLSVRGSLYLLDRLRAEGFGIKSLGTLWSLYRATTRTHVEYVEALRNGRDDLAALPKPFKTVIPNASAITRVCEAGGSYKSFNDKYETQFAKLFRGLVDEIIERCDAQAKQAAAATVQTVPAVAPTRVPAVRKAK